VFALLDAVEVDALPDEDNFAVIHLWAQFGIQRQAIFH
jgi:hypothetical protein